MIAGRSATADTVARIRSELGLDQPLPVQYARYLARLVRGNLGRSYAQKIEVTDLLRSRLAATFWLMLGGIAFELLIGLPVGMLAALRRRSAMDQSVMVGAFLGVAALQFVVVFFLRFLLALLLVLFAVGRCAPPGRLSAP